MCKDYVDINNIKARVLVHGDMFWVPAAQVASCEFPIGSDKHINFASSLWMSGYDAGNQLHVAAQTYRQNGNDYWPGIRQCKCSRFWRVTCSECSLNNAPGDRRFVISKRLYA